MKKKIKIKIKKTLKNSKFENLDKFPFGESGIWQPILWKYVLVKCIHSKEKYTLFVLNDHLTF